MHLVLLSDNIAPISSTFKHINDSLIITIINLFGIRFFITIKKGLAVKQVPFSMCGNIEHKNELAKAHFRKYRTFPRVK